MRSRKEKQYEKKDHELDHASQQASLILSEDLKVVKDLGEGQYGVVQLGEWKPLHKELKCVAMKSIKNTAIDGVLSSTLQETLTLQRLRHDNIVIFYGISLPSGEQPLRLITEFAPYGSLHDNFVKKNKNVFKVSTLCKFASQVAHGMHFLASQQMVHRDLATRNILLFDQDLVKISDFGLARSLEGNGMKEITPRTKLAVAWMAPEVVEKGIFTPASDGWSYGITLWEMFSFGQRPWAEFSLQQIKQMVSCDPSKHLVKPHACPDGFYELILLKCWAREPKDRLTFGYIVYNVLPQLQPKEGRTKVCHKSAVEGQLSYDSREKVTIISRVGDGMSLVQIEDGSIGFIDEEHVKFPKKPGGAYPMQISTPFKVKKMEKREVFAELQTFADDDMNKAMFAVEINHLLKQAEGKQPHDNLQDLDEDDVDLDPNYTLYPDPYPDMTVDWTNTGATGLASGGVEGGEEYYMSMDPVNASVVKGQENLTRQPDFQIPSLQRSGRTMSESEVLAYNPHYEVPFQNIKDSKDDSSVQLGSKGTPGGKKSPPVMPARLDLPRKTTNDTSDRGAGLSPYPTTPRKRPVPTPRRKTVKKLHPSAKNDLEESITHSNTEIRVVPGTQSVARADGQKKVRPKPPLPFESTKIVKDSALGKDDANASVKSGSEKSDKPRCLETTGYKEPDQSAQADSIKNLLPTVCVAQHGDVTASIAPHGDVTASVTTHGDVAASVTTHGDITASIAPHGDVTSSVVSHSDVTAFKAPRGAGSGESASRSVTSHVPLVQDMSSKSQPPVISFDQRDNTGLFPQPRYENSSVIKDLIDFSRVNGDCPPLPPKQHAQETPVYDKPRSLAMYPDIPPEVLNQPPPPPEELFGGTAPRPDAHQGDVQQVVRMIKAQNLAKITGKTEQFCTRTLTHCNWDLDRAANYILENYEDKDV